MSLAATVEKLRSALLERGSKLSPPATEEAIKAAEQRLGCEFPEALRKLHRSFDGSTHEDDVMWQFWPLRNLSFVESSDPPGRLLCFCDVMIHLPVYGLWFEPDRNPEEVWCLVGTSFHPCSASVERFLTRLPAEMDFPLLDDDRASHP